MKAKKTLIQFIALVLLELIILYPVDFVYALSISNVNITDIGANSARVKWFTDEVADGKVKYGPTKDLGFTSRQSTFIFEHSQLLQGLDSEKTYFIEIESSNINGDVAVNNNNGQLYSFATKDITPPPKVEGLTVTGKTKNSIAISWQASNAQDLSRYNIFRNSIRIANTTDTAFKDANLNPGSAFSYKVSAIDLSGNEGAQSDTVIASTEASDLSSPVISEVDIAEITDTTATITWLTSKNGTSVVFFGTGQSLDRKEEIKKQVKNHSVTLDALEKGTSYNFVVSSCDNDNNCANSSISSFEAGLGAKAPGINATIPMFVNKKEIDITGSTEPFSSVKLFVNDLNFPIRALDSKETPKGIFEFRNVQLLKENVIKLLVTDKAGNKNESIFRVSVDTENPIVIIDQVPGITSKKNLTIVGTVDEPVTINFFLRFGSKEKPEKIIGLNGAAKNNSIKLEWNETKNEDFSHYIIYRKDVGPIAIAKPASYNTYTDLLVNKGQEYAYWITIVDKFGKESDISDAVAVKVTDGRNDIPKPQPIDSLIIENPELNISVNNSFSESLKLEKDGEYTLLMEVIDRANNRVTIQRVLTLDTKKPDIKITNPPSGTMIFESYANEIDVKGITEPNAKVHLYIERTPLGELNKSFDVSGLPNKIEDIPESKLDADCSLKIGGRNFCPESADFSTTADSSGNFEFENVDLTSIVSGGIGIEQVPGTQLTEEIRPETTKTSRLVFIATDSAGLRNAKEHRINIGTCWSGNQSFDIIPLTEFQSPTLLSPERLAENKEIIYFFFNYSYIGRGMDPKVESVSLQRACSGTEVLGDKRFNTSCKIMPSGGFSTAVNPEGTVTYTAIKLNRVENMNKFLENDWKGFFKSVSNELTFPLKVTIRYRHTVDGKQIIETQTTCQEVTYVMDNSIVDPRNILPDFLLYDFVDFLQNTVKVINEIDKQLNRVLEYVAIGCVASLGIRTLVFEVYRRYISFQEEKIFQLKDLSKRIIPGSDMVKFDVKNDEDQKYCNAVAENIKKAYITRPNEKISNKFFGLKLKYFSDKDLKKCFPAVADAWENEANWYNYYRYTCDRVFGHQTPSGWTENLDDETIYQRVLQGNQCPNDQSVYGQTLQAINCRDALKEFPAAERKNFGVDDTCFKVPDGRRVSLYYLGNLVGGSENVYEINYAAGPFTKETKYAIKSSQSEKSYMTSLPRTCAEVCGAPLGSPKNELTIGGKDPIKRYTEPKTKIDPKTRSRYEKGYVCVEASTCRAWNQQKKVEYGGQEFDVGSTFLKGYTSDCFPDKDEELSFISNDPNQRIECCCLNSMGKLAPSVYNIYDDLNRYAKPFTEEKDSSFESKKNLPAPENYEDMKWSYRYWKEGFIALCNPKNKDFEKLCPSEKVQHTQYNPNRYIEGRDFPACFGQNNYLYEGLKTPPAGETGSLVMIDSRQQLESAFFCANIGGIHNRFVLYSNLANAMSKCLIDIRQTGTTDAAACKEFFTRYVCSLTWDAIQFLSNLVGGNSCSTNTLGFTLEDEDDYTSIVSGGFKAVTQSISDTQSELAKEYGNVELNNLLGTGAGEIARKICLGAFGYDWDFNLQNLIDAAYSQSFETLVQKVTGTREYLTIDPTTGQARYEYRSSWIINPGCDIESYKAELACVSRNELNREGEFLDPLRAIGTSIGGNVGRSIEISSRGIRCDAVGSPDGNNCDCLNLDREQTRTFFTSKGKLPQNKFVQEAKDDVVSSLYRYDHIKLTLRTDRKLKGSLKGTCFPPGHEDGVFYFPLTDKTARDVAACEADSVSGVFQCKGAADFWSKKGLSYIVDILVNNEKPIDNKFTVFKGEQLTITPTVFKTPGSPKKCLVMSLEKQGMSAYPQVVDIELDGLQQYPPLKLEENIQPVQNVRFLSSPRYVACEPRQTCENILLGLGQRTTLPTFRLLQRGNIQELELIMKFTRGSNNKNSIIDLSENSADRLDLEGVGITPQSKFLGRDGWYDEQEKAPVIFLPEHNIKLKIDYVPFGKVEEVNSVTYSQIIPPVGASTTAFGTDTERFSLSDNIWRLRIGLFEADGRNDLVDPEGRLASCSRYNAGETVSYQGNKQDKTYTIRVVGQQQDINAPRVRLDFDRPNLRPDEETSTLRLDANSDKTRVGKISFWITRPGSSRTLWGSVNSNVESVNSNVQQYCKDELTGTTGGRKICSIDVNTRLLEANEAGTYKIDAVVPDEDTTPHSTTAATSIEVLCGPKAKSYGICLQGSRCDRTRVIEEGMKCQDTFQCCESYER